MVSPWMHQRARENLSYDMTGIDHELRQTRTESSNSRAEIHMPNAASTIPIPKPREDEVEKLVFRAKGVAGTLRMMAGGLLEVPADMMNWAHLGHFACLPYVRELVGRRGVY
ncbi:hypothetical protein HDV63DRAFT_278520 [Trichoderma sp. SZMC 28014]